MKKMLFAGEKLLIKAMNLPLKTGSRCETIDNVTIHMASMLYFWVGHLKENES